MWTRYRAFYATLVTCSGPATVSGVPGGVLGVEKGEPKS